MCLEILYFNIKRQNTELHHYSEQYHTESAEQKNEKVSKLTYWLPKMDPWIYGCELKWIQLALLSWSSCSPQNISNPTHPAPSDFAMIGMNRALIGLMGLPGLLYKYSWYSSWSILQAGESRCLARVVHSALSPLSHYGNASSNSIQ